MGPPILATPLYYNYDQQQYDEITTLFEVVAGEYLPILMGDFNHGPASPGPNFSWELPFHYGLMTACGFVSPFVLRDCTCTFCVDNPSVMGQTSDLVIDHIYVPTNMVRRVKGVRVSNHFDQYY